MLRQAYMKLQIALLLLQTDPFHFVKMLQPEFEFFGRVQGERWKTFCRKIKSVRVEVISGEIIVYKISNDKPVDTPGY